MLRRSLIRILLVVFVLSPFPFEVHAQRDHNVLQPGSSTTRAIGKGERLWYTVALQQDQFAQVVVYQRGVDLMVRVSSPDRRNVTVFDSPNGDTGPENVKIVAATPGLYTVEVSPLFPADTGQFEIRLTEIRLASPLELQAARRPDILRAKGMALLETLAGLLPEVRSPQSRVRFQVQAAQFLWPAHEGAARKLAIDAMTEVQQLLAREASSDENNGSRDPVSLRQEVFQLVSRYDPGLALTFLRATRTLDVEAQQSGNQEIHLEMTAAYYLAEKDPRRAFQIAHDVLERGYSSQLGSLISLLRKSEPVLAMRLMKNAVTRLNDEELLTTPDAANLAVSLLQVARTPAPRNPAGPISIPEIAMISPLEHRSLFTKTLDAALAVEFAPNAYSPESNAARHILQSLKSMAEELRGFTPGKGALVEEKLELMNMGRSGWARDNRNVINDSPVDVALDAVVRAPKDQRDSLYYQISLKAANAGDFNLARHIVTFMVNRVQRRSALDNIERTVVNDAINKGRLDEALAGIRNMKSRSERVSMISQILHSVGQGQKADAAINLLEQARALIATPRGEDQSQVSVLLQIAGVFARYDPHRGFDIVEPFLDQFNDLTVAASALNGFGEEYYQNGELALHNGNGLADVANELVQAIAKLAAADFDRARNAVDRIQRPEVRISAFLAIGRQAIHPPPTWIRTW